jgi:autotransporter-associated beta strand protein
MKTKLTLLKLTILLCCAFATTAAFGQVIIWTNPVVTAPNGNNIGVSTNWNGGPGAIGVGVTATFNGGVPGPMNLVTFDGHDHTGFAIGGDFGANGISLDLTPGQTSPVTLTCPNLTCTSVGFRNITMEAGAGQLTLGDSTLNDLDFTMRPSGGTFDWINNSANPVIINSSLTWQAGGGIAYTIILDGIGDWGITNKMVTHNGTTVTLAILTSGTVTWTAPSSVPVVSGTMGVIASPFVINAGTLILKTNNLLTTQAINNNSGVLTPIIYDGNSPQTLSGAISGPISLTVKSGTLTLSGANIYTGGTTISGATLQVGAGGTSGTVGSGNVTNNGQLVFNRSDNVTFTNPISGGGSVVQNGSGTLTLTAANTYTGSTTVSNGTLVVSSVGGDMNVSGGTLAPAAAGTIGTLSVSNNMTISSGTIQATVNKSLSPSNSVYLVANNLTATGGTLKLVNYGPAFAPGDRFVIFRQVDGVTPMPVSGGLSMTVTAPGVTSFINNLATDGSMTVSTVTATPMAFTAAAQAGGNVNLSWPAVWTGVHLQSQTNTLANGLNTNWVTIPGSDAANSYSAPMIKSNAVFYRLAP